MSTNQKRTPDQPRVLVVVKDGVADAIFDDGVRVEFFDWDDYGADPVGTDAVPAEFADLAEVMRVPVRYPGYFVTVTQRSPSGAEHDVNGIITRKAALNGEMVERVALNLVAFSDGLYRAPAEKYGDNVFCDSENFEEGHSYWVNTVKPLTAEHLEALSQYITTVDYDALLQHGEVEML